MSQFPALPPDIKELMVLVRAGKLFAVQKWIQEGKRINPPKPYYNSPLRVAIQTKFHSMVEVLLQAGVDQDHVDFLLRHTLWKGNFEIVKLLLDYKASIGTVSMYDVFSSGNPDMMRHFLDAGLDVSKGDPFARALKTPIRPHLAIYKAYKEKVPELTRQMNMALKYHAKKGSLKWVCLFLWAGADPHARLPHIDEKDDAELNTTALEDAVYYGHIKIVEKIGLNSAGINLTKLLEAAASSGDPQMIEKVLAAGADPNPPGEYTPMHILLSKMEWATDTSFGSTWMLEKSFQAILLLADKGGKLTENEYTIPGLRRAMHNLDGKMIAKIVTGFREHGVFTAEQLVRLINTKKMKELLGPRTGKLLKSLESASIHKPEDQPGPRD